jgi:TRAP-type C4-dicarboxylate transport system substrate-binding protein
MTMPMTRRAALLAAGGALALPAIGGAQTQYRAEYKLSVVGNRPIPLADGAFRWAELVTQRTQGRINVRVYPGSQLVGGDQTRELVAMRQGVIDMAVFSTINISPQVREMNLFSLPFLLQDSRGFDAIIRGEIGQELFRTLATRDVGAGGLGRERLPRDLELPPADPHAGGPAAA